VKLSVLPVLALLGLALGAPGPTPDRGGARPGAVATVRLEVRLEPGLTVNRLGPSRFWLENPFTGQRLEAAVGGQPWPGDPLHYLETVRPVRFALKVPASARPGEWHRLRLGAQFALCDQAIHVCFVRQVEGSATLEVARSGTDGPIVFAAVLEVRRSPAR